jgi:hypothetical protein
VDELATDWIVLGDGDETSWQLDYDLSASMRRGSHIRLNWDATRPLPKSLAGSGAVFPAVRSIFEVTVQ